ncbi:MAG: histidine phosphatase family protein [Gammaproteobacteria bacterium]|nr:histidine phosphatase family protein [Gammaproteobacteria bacterium]MCP4491001.1 histidine phosphatase family protein [Gammaproteobacteria bacterium]
MKTVYLLRHAKSSWANPGQDDCLRPLNRRGMDDAPEMGRRFKLRGEELDRVLVSTALRTRITAELFVKAAGYAREIIDEEPDLYFSSMRMVEDIILEQDDRFQALMLVFHNPDITYFANSINTANRITNVPTCGLIKLEGDINQWLDWSVRKTSFCYFDYPKKISA